MANRVKFNLKNVHYAVMTYANDTPTYGTVKPWHGAVSMSLSPDGSFETVKADGIDFYAVSDNQGYSGDYESAEVPEDFAKDILGEIEDDNSVMVEDADTQPVHFALLFEFDGDKNHVRHVVYNNVAQRPNIQSTTQTENRTIQTDSINITSMPVYIDALDKSIVRAKTKSDTDTEVYNGWFNQVYIPTIS